MIIKLDEFDKKRLEILNDTMLNNGEAMDLLANYVTKNERLIRPDMLQRIVGGYDMEPSLAYAMLVASACGMEINENDAHKQFFDDYIVRSIKRLDVNDFKGDPYLKTIKFPQKTFGAWELTMESYAPCEAFVYDEPVQTSDFKEIPQIGFFEEEFSFPAVKQDGREWMAVKPSEILTMQPAIENAHGNILAYGLGLGYFAFMASGKRSVKSVTIVEKDSNIIELFKTELLPQFPNAEKISIIEADAFEYAEKLSAEGAEHYDYIFTDIWHDTADGLAMYLKMKRLNSKIRNTDFGYWIERSLLSRLRYTVFSQLYRLAKTSVRKQVADDELVIETFQDFLKQISDNGLREIAARKS
ncbi:MAG: hypothetical protein IJ894_16760 [Bacteroidales bacterium]|nr:hypothetical protein [Bacteroidales bacterium]